MLTISKRKYNRKFFRKYGYKVSDKPTQPMLSPKEQRDYEDSYGRSAEADEADRLIMEGYVEDYPKNPRFKSHLYAFYMGIGERDEAKKMALRMLNQHPDYLFSKLNLAETCMLEGNYEMVDKMLGESRKIETIAPDTEVFHVSEFLSYYSISACCAIKTDDRDTSEEYLAMMIDLAPDHHITKNTAIFMMDEMVGKVSEKAKKAEAACINNKDFPTYTPEPTQSPPKLNHQELEAFYLYGEDDLPKEIMEDILQLPRETLIADLENILEDSIRRYKYFYDKYVEFDENEQSFPIHALRFLGALEAHESVQSVLNLFRQGQNILEYWFADRLKHYVVDTLLIMGSHQLEALKAYTLEANQYFSPRTYTFDAIVQIGLHHPERHDEVMQAIKEIFDYYLQHANDKTIIDTDFINWAILHATYLRDESLIEYVDKFDEKNWLISFISGSVENLKKDILSPLEPAAIDPVPLNIHEFYNHEHLKRRAELEGSIDDILSKNSQKIAKYFIELTAEAMLVKKLKEAGILDLIDEYKNDEDDSLFLNSHTNYLGSPDSSDRYEYQEPVVRETSKLSRNAPCPCGSGKKYKRCCLKKAK